MTPDSRGNNKPHRWTQGELDALVKAVDYGKRQGHPLSEVFAEFAAERNLSVSAVQAKYYATRKSKVRKKRQPGKRATPRSTKRTDANTRKRRRKKKPAEPKIPRKPLSELPTADLIKLQQQVTDELNRRLTGHEDGSQDS